MDESSSGANQGWTSVLGSSSGGSSEASVNQPHPNSDVPSNPNRAGPSAPPVQDANVGDPPAPLIPFLQEEGGEGISFLQWKKNGADLKKDLRVSFFYVEGYS